MIKKYLLGFIFLSNFNFCEAMNQPQDSSMVSQKTIPEIKQELKNIVYQIHELQALFNSLTKEIDLPVKYLTKTIEEIENERAEIKPQIKLLLEETQNPIALLREKQLTDTEILKILESAH